MSSLAALLILVVVPYLDFDYSQPTARIPYRIDDPHKDARAAENREERSAPQRNTAPAVTLPAQPQTETLKAERDFKKQNGYEQRQDGYDEWFNKLATAINVASTVAIAIFTILLVRFGARQAEATRQSVEAMRESTRVALDALSHARDTAKAQLEETRRANTLTLRAWLIIDRVALDERWLPSETLPGVIWITVIARNAGKVPALSINATMTVEILPESEPLPTPFIKIENEGVVIASGESKMFLFGVRHMTMERIYRLRADDLYFGVKAGFAYTDALGTAGETTQAAHYNRGTAEYREYLYNQKDGRTMT